MSAAARADAARPLTVLYMDLGKGWRGGQRQLLWTARGLRARGHRPILALRPGSALVERAAAEGIHVVHVDPSFPEWGPWTVARLRRIIARERVDIVHPQSGHTMALAALATLGARTPVVLARRVIFPFRKNPGSRWKYGRAAHFIAVSHAAARGVVNAGFPPSRVDVVYSGMDLTRRIEPAPPDTLAALGIPPGAPLAVMVAAIVTMKDPLTFVRGVAEAHRRLPQMHAMLVGEGHLRPDVEQLVQELGLQDVLHLTGFRTDADALLRAADVFVLSSNNEGEALGSILLDAMALRRPIAATAGGGIPEVVEHERTGLLAPVGDGVALGANIARLLTDRELAARLADAAFRKVQAFSIEDTVDRTIQIYQRVLAERRR
ncbi:MAG TPA: glycosyltransferase family 4 protein [Gemmatimonadaceae bacterium]|nr:glycosyltransferase family 4 protein [Gemmatimonadaceae bacterium]